MYEYIRGEVETITPAIAVIEASGVGYLLNISLQTFTRVGSSREAKLYTHFIVREDAQVLYGFYDRTERDIFRMLIGVSGVGGGTARMILSTFNSDEVCSIVANSQAELLKTVKGLGLKTAQKIIVELRDKIGVASGGGMADGLLVAAGVNAASKAIFEEALSALTMLGFVKAASEKILKQLLKENPACTVEELVRQSLKRM